VLGFARKIRDTNDGRTHSTYDPANEQIRFNSATPNLVYDNNGNLTSFTDGTGTTTYTWNARNQIAAISGLGLSASFVYDGLGRRTSKTINSATTGYWYDGDDVLAELTGSTPTATYVRGLAIDEPFIRKGASDEFYQSDVLGSALVLTDASGVAQTSYSCEAFGKTTITGMSSNPFQYTGRENDGSGLFYYRARYYSPQLQRFLSEDPAFSEMEDQNPYTYVLNSPMNLIDPTGRIVQYSDAPGCVISYNAYPPQTLRASPLTEEKVCKLQSCMGRPLVVTGGSEKQKHLSRAHKEGRAVDFSFKRNPGLDRTKFFCCAKKSGFGFGIQEDDPPHFHLESLTVTKGAQPNMNFNRLPNNACGC